MTNKELKKLNRRELLEMLIVQIKDNEQLRNEIEEKNALLEERSIKLRNAGNIAQAALELNKIFETAQSAADQYLANIKQSGVVAEKRNDPVAMQAKIQADMLIADAEKERILKKEKELFEKEQEYRYLRHFYKKYKWLADILD